MEEAVNNKQVTGFNKMVLFLCEYIYMHFPLQLYSFSRAENRTEDSLNSCCIKFETITITNGFFLVDRNSSYTSLADTPPPPETTTAAYGTHPTGMHSCFCFCFCRLKAGTILTRTKLEFIHLIRLVLINIQT